MARKAAKKEAAKVETDSNFISLTIDVEGLTSTTRRLLKNNVRSVSTAAATARRLGGARGDRAAAADLAATARASASAVQVSFRLQERKRRAGARGEEKRRKRAKKRRQCHHEKQSNAGHTTDRRGIRGKKKDGTRKLGKQREPHGASAFFENDRHHGRDVEERAEREGLQVCGRHQGSAEDLQRRRRCATWEGVA